jgi:D-arabinose 1-dehydrogenase-like Zn-dependent alcohol dehydrogenase
MPTFTVYKGSKDGGPKKSSTTRPDELKEDQVRIKVTASGLCGTGELNNIIQHLTLDLHYAHADMGLGHEGVGIVEELGPEARELKVGDRVGWGYTHDACGNCKDCLEGWNTFCPERKLYGYANLDQGSFSDGAIWREQYLFKLPDNIADEHAAPLVSPFS